MSSRVPGPMFSHQIDCDRVESAILSRNEPSHEVGSIHFMIHCRCHHETTPFSESERLDETTDGITVPGSHAAVMASQLQKAAPCINRGALTPEQHNAATAWKTMRASWGTSSGFAPGAQDLSIKYGRVELAAVAAVALLGLHELFSR